MVELMVPWDHHVWNLCCNVLDLIHEIVALPSIILKRTLQTHMKWKTQPFQNVHEPAKATKSKTLSPKGHPQTFSKLSRQSMYYLVEMSANSLLSSQIGTLRTFLVRFSQLRISLFMDMVMSLEHTYTIILQYPIMAKVGTLHKRNSHHTHVWVRWNRQFIYRCLEDREHHEYH